MDLLSDLKKGKRGAIAKAITIIENDQKETKKLLKEIFKDSGNSSIIGITGPAGAGKSSLINKTVISLKKLGTNLLYWLLILLVILLEVLFWVTELE